VRLKAPQNDDLLEVLEQLPLLVGGVWVPPMHAARERRVVDVGAEVRATIEAVRAVIAETPSVRSLPPWSCARPYVPALRATSFPSTFARMVALHPARLEALPAWWRDHKRGECVEIASRLLLEEPRQERLGLWRICGSLRSPWRMRSIPVELWLWPRLNAWTKLALEPHRDVHVGRRYFSTGQRVLDELCGRLINELGA
jgi:hypothetical protein